jgi:hypothetical protein
MTAAIFDERNAPNGIDARFLIVSALEVSLTITAPIVQNYIVGITAKLIFFLCDVYLYDFITHSSFPGSGYALSNTC